MTTVDIETLLAQDDLRSLIEACEHAGAIRAPEVHRDRRDPRAGRARAGGARARAREARDRDRRGAAAGCARARRGAAAARAGGPGRDHDGRAPVVPPRGEPPPAAHRGARGDPREADRARRRGREGRDDPVEPPPRRLDRQELPQPGAPVPRPDPGGNARADPRRGEVRLAARLQVLDVCDLVDPAGGCARAGGQGADDPDARPHRRAAAEDQPRRAVAVDAARPRADARGDRRRGLADARSRSSRCAPPRVPHQPRRADRRRRRRRPR